MKSKIVLQKEVSCLLDKYREGISKSLSSLGTCGLMKGIKFEHTIESLIFRRTYGIPFAKRDMVDKIVNAPSVFQETMNEVQKMLPSGNVVCNERHLPTD